MPKKKNKRCACSHLNCSYALLNVNHFLELLHVTLLAVDKIGDFTNTFECSPEKRVILQRVLTVCVNVLCAPRCEIPGRERERGWALAYREEQLISTAKEERDE